MLPQCQGHLCDKGLLSKWHHAPYIDVRPVLGPWLSQPAPSAPLWLRSTDLFSPQRSNACSGCESVNRASKLLTLRFWGLMCASYPRGGHAVISRAGGLCDRTEVKTYSLRRPDKNSLPFLHPKIPSECHHGVVRCVGRCHLHLFPVFTSAIDSCAPIFIKPLFHSFPPVICLSLPTHTTPSSLLSLSSTSPQMSLSTHLLSPWLHTGANTQRSVFCPCR